MKKIVSDRTLRHPQLRDALQRKRETMTNQPQPASEICKCGHQDWVHKKDEVGWDDCKAINCPCTEYQPDQPQAEAREAAFHAVKEFVWKQVGWSRGEVARYAFDAGHAAALAVDETCEWKFDDNDYAPMWTSGCGQDFSFVDGGLFENHFKFCHYCGKKIVDEIGQKYERQQRAGTDKED